MENKLTPIWVKNPETSKEYDVAPIFKQMNRRVFSLCNSPKDLELHIDLAIRYIGVDSKPLNPDSEEMNTVLHNLYQLRDMFEAMEEREPNS